MTQAQSRISEQGQYVPGNPLEMLFNEMSSGLLASGRTVEVQEESDGEELTASVPQGKRPQNSASQETGGPTTSEIEAAVQRVNDYHHGTAKQ